MTKTATLAIAIPLAIVAILACALAATPVQAAPAGAPLQAPGDCVVTTTADSGPGSLRQCMLNLQSDMTITFDVSVFPPASPATIALTSGLPAIVTDHVTIDGSNAGVVLDGSGIGTTPEILLLDDVSLTLGGGPNLILNGDFAAGTGHWRPLDERPGATRAITTADYQSSSSSYQWTAIAHAGILHTVYDTTDTSDPLSEWPLASDSTAWIPATGDTTAQLRFWYRYSTTTGRLLARFSDGHQETVGDWWCPSTADWTECTLSTALPDDVTGVALAFELNHIDRWTAGLAIRSNGNVIRGLQIVHWPGNGMDVRGQDNVIGGDRGLGAGPMGQGNLIGGGGGYGLFVGGSGTSTSYNTIAGNYVGTDVSGASALVNAWAGISLQDGAHHNLIGGDAPGEGNLVSGSGSDGIWLTGSGVDHNTISGNRVGTDASGTAAIPNGGFGIIIRSGAKYNVVGGDSAGEHNLISGNGNCGLVIMDPGTDYTVVRGNYIGTDASGTAAIPNPQCGVGLWGGSQRSTIGGIAPGEGNLISGNAAAGIWISGSDNNVVLGNYIGTDASGTAELGNGPPGPGVFILDGARHNIIGTDTPEGRNLISGNHGDGVSITGSGTTSNTVSGNYIGTDASGTVALPNSGAGVELDGGSSHSLIGGDTPGERNLISGNGTAGVAIDNGSSYNTVSGNYIGTDISGATALPNVEEGVRILGEASYNLVGGDAPDEGNLISGNDGSGVTISDGSSNNTVSGNYVGTDLSGTTCLYNDGNAAVHLIDGASHNLIGGDTPAERNLLGCEGVTIGNPWSSDSFYNRIVNNYIGVDPTGALLYGGMFQGILLWEDGSYTEVISNTIRGFKQCGIGIQGDVQELDIRGNTIADNGYDYSFTGGIIVGMYSGEAWGVTMSANSIYSNTGPGIELLYGANAGIVPPTIAYVDPATGMVSGTACANCRVEVFSDDGDEGCWYHGWGEADGAGRFALTATVPLTGLNVTATATDAQGNTSEFGRVARDVAVTHLSPIGQVAVNEASPILVTLHNLGGQLESGVPVTCQIAHGTATLYIEVQTTGDLYPDGELTLAFPGYTPQTGGVYTLTCRSALPGDSNAANDARSVALTVSSAGTPDVWIKDNPPDSGDVPSKGHFWQSPDIWVRHAADGGLTHQNPVQGVTNTLYIRLRNRGDATASGAVQVHAAKPALGGICGPRWLQPVATIPFSDLAPGEVRVVSTPWVPSLESHVFLGAVIDAVGDPPAFACPYHARWDNNLAVRHVHRFDNAGAAQGTIAAVQQAEVALVNAHSVPKDVDLVVERLTFPTTGTVTIELPEGLLNRWLAYGGRWSEGMEVLTATHEVRVTGAVSATMGALPMLPGEAASLSLRFELDAGAACELALYARIDGTVEGGVGYEWYLLDRAFQVYLPLVVR